MSRYFSRPAARRLYVEDQRFDEENPLVAELYVSDFEDTDTGLLDLNGETIWRAPNPIGFGREDEW